MFKYIGERYIGNSNEIKPLTAATGAEFHELDTHSIWHKKEIWYLITGGQGGTGSSGYSWLFRNFWL